MTDWVLQPADTTPVVSTPLRCFTVTGVLLKSNEKVESGEVGGGRFWIRTREGVSQQIYSLPPLATWVTYHEGAQIKPNQPRNVNPHTGSPWMNLPRTTSWCVTRRCTTARPTASSARTQDRDRSRSTTSRSTTPAAARSISPLRIPVSMQAFASSNESSD